MNRIIFLGLVGLLVFHGSWGGIAFARCPSLVGYYEAAPTQLGLPILEIQEARNPAIGEYHILERVRNVKNAVGETRSNEAHCGSAATGL